MTFYPSMRQNRHTCERAAAYVKELSQTWRSCRMTRRKSPAPGFQVENGDEDTLTLEPIHESHPQNRHRRRPRPLRGLGRRRLYAGGEAAGRPHALEAGGADRAP